MKLKHECGSLADQYHIASSNTRTAKRARKLLQLHFAPEMAELLKERPLHPEGSSSLSLPRDFGSLRMTVEEAITSRRSSREFSHQPLPAGKLSRLLYLANGFRDYSDNPFSSAASRNVPSSGGLGSVEIYCFILNVAGVEPGIYHFDSRCHKLSLLKAGHFGVWLNEFALIQVEFSEAAAVLVLTSKIARLAKKYGLRSYRLALLDAGHVSQNIYLAATAMDLAVCATAGFIDSEINEALDLDGLDNCAVLTLGVGVSGAKSGAIAPADQGPLS